MSGKDKYVAYVGTYTHSNSIGIHVYDVDPAEGRLTERSVTPINNPSYLCTSRDGRFLYSIADEGVAAFSIDQKTGDLTRINQMWIGGMRGCYVDVDSRNRYLFVAGFHDGRVTMMRLEQDGSVGDIADGIFHQGVAISANDRRLDHPEVSCVRLTPDEQYLCAADHGLNQIKIYRVDYLRGKLKLVDIIRCAMDSGPRALRFSADGKFLYVLTELDRTMEVYAYSNEKDEPNFELVQKVPVMDQEFPTAAAICFVFNEDESEIFVSIDGINGISFLARDPQEGTLTYENMTLCSGDYPKSLIMLPGNEYYAVLNHDTNEIRTFRYFPENHYGLMKNAPVSVDKPNCIRILKLS